MIPYNRDLCVKYDAHINIERIAVRSVVKYLYKYVRIGHDRATIIVTPQLPNQSETLAKTNQGSPYS